MRSPCWLFGVHLCLRVSMAPSQWADRRRASLANATPVWIPCDVWEDQGSRPLHDLQSHVRARQLINCISVSVPQSPARLGPDSGAAGTNDFACYPCADADSDAAGPSMPASPGMPNPQRKPAKGGLSSSPRRQQRFPVPGSSAWPPRSPLSTQCPNGARRSLTKPKGTSFGSAIRSHTASENIVSNP